jgi:lycopene beta-cyclase
MKHYDYIVCGAGCAGLTFLYEILSLQNLQHKKILVIDSSFKKENDRTWCFWEKEKSRFENLVCHSWENLHFSCVNFSAMLNIVPYTYKQIKGIDFYNYILNFAKQFNNVELVESEIINFKNENNLAYVKTNIETFSAEYIFNSTFINTNINDLKTENSLLQHFKGIEIETSGNYFNPHQATFMDFTINQKLGTAFVYVLPTSPNKALVEYTFFTKNVLQQNEYDDLLKGYINNTLKIINYKITHTEFGVIPMTDYVFKKYNDKIINIGTVGGAVKASTGFAFNNIQKQIKQIVALLAQDKKPYLRRTFAERKFHLYDSVLLEVITKNKIKGHEIFAAIFKKNKPQLVLKFLDNETNIFEDLKIMSSVPTKIFLPIALKQFLFSCCSFSNFRNRNNEK